MRNRRREAEPKLCGWLSIPAVLVLVVAGCGSGESGTSAGAAPAAGAFDPRPPSTTAPAGLPRAAQPEQRTANVPPSVAPQELPQTQRSPPGSTRSLADLLPADGTIPPPAPPELPLPAIDDLAVSRLGIRRIAGQHLALYTDLPPDQEVDGLPVVFDRAVPQWAEYFSIEPDAVRSWKVVGYLIRDKDRFRQAGLLPSDLPEFLHGFQRDSELWLYEQPSAYYRRHLLLHEGTHAFMQWSLSGSGPPWYMEGTAELLATHRWSEGELTLRYFPADRNEVPEWGRVKIIRDEYRANRALTIMDVLRYDTRAHLRLEPYGWCWALAAFLDGHPAFQQRFRNLSKHARDTGPNFSERFLGWFREDGHRLWREWQWYVMNMDYGYNVAAEAIQYQAVDGLPPGGTTVRIAANRGWQSSGIRLEAGQLVRLVATGRYTLRTHPQPWPCEPDGVTIRYYLGQPLGMLLAAIVDESTAEATDNGFLTPQPIGSRREWTPLTGGTLFLRINDLPAEVADNEGTVAVRVATE